MNTLEQIEKKIFDQRFPWGAIDVQKALTNIHVLELVREACLVESYFALYTGKMLELFAYDVSATSIYTIEAFEAYTHYYSLRKYLDIVNFQPITDIEIAQLREKDKDVVYTDEIRELVNFMATEHFAAHFFKDLSEIAPEPVLKQILLRMSSEEVSHARFAFDLLRTRFEKNTGIKKNILEHAKRFQHVGSYVLPTVSSVKEDNIKIIQSFNQMLEELVGESLSDYLLTLQK